MWRSFLVAMLLLLTPAVCLAADKSVDQEQARLYSMKLLEILNPVGIAILVGFQFVVAFLAAALSARISFSCDRILVRTIKWYVYSFLCAIGIVILILVLVLIAQQAGLLIGAFLALALVVWMIFGLPMRVFESGFLRVLLFLVVLAIVNAIASWGSTLATPLLFGSETGAQIQALTEDLANRRIQADKDYSKISGEEQEVESSVPASTTQPVTLQQEAAALNARFAALKERFATLDKTNAAEVTQYNSDYKKYTDDLNAYNARVKAAQPVTP